MMSPIPTAFRKPQGGISPLQELASDSMRGEPEPADDFTAPIPLADPATAELPPIPAIATTSSATTLNFSVQREKAELSPAGDVAAEPLSGMTDSPTAQCTRDGGGTPELVIGPGTLLRERYRIDRQIGAGGFSLIYRAIDLHRETAGSTIHFVAIKLLKPEFRSLPEASNRLKREFYRLEMLCHPHIGRALDLDHDGNVWFLALELLEGLSLSSMFSRQTPLDRQVALRIIQACGEALDFAHAHGILHCDFKPGNILVTQTEEIKVIDFGAGFDQFLPLTATLPSSARSHRHATAAYASPEALAGKDPDVRDDVFSFATVVYELLAGKRPYAPRDAFDKSTVPTRPAGLTHRQWKILLEALCLTEANRLTSIRTLTNALKPRALQARRWVFMTALACAAGAFLLLQIEPRFNRDPVMTASTPTIAAGGAATSTLVQLVFGATKLLPAAAPRQQAASEANLPAANPPRSTRASVPSPEVTLVSLDRSELIITRPTAMAAMILQRNGGPARRAQIRWRTIPGTAVPGIDYMSVADGVVNFADNQNISSLYVPLLTREDLTEDRTFQIEITSSSRQVEVGPVVRVTVTIRG